MRYFLKLIALELILALGATAIAQMPSYDKVGKKPTEKEIQAWDIAIGPSGKELPPGSGTAKEGKQIYARSCAGCHGATGEEGQTQGREAGRIAPSLVGGQGTLNTARPVRTVGSYFAFATTIWDFINRSMPRGKEGSLTADEVYAVTAYLLNRNGIIAETEVMDAKTLPKVKMPNRNGYAPARPDWKLYQNCKRFLNPTTDPETCR